MACKIKNKLNVLKEQKSILCFLNGTLLTI